MAAPSADDYRTYWSVVAQVLPVLALSIVVEARAVASSWAASPGLLTRQQRGMMSGWIASLAGFLLVEPVAVEGALDGAEHSFYRGLARISITLALASLVVIPLIDLALRRTADTTARLIVGTVQYARKRSIRERERIARDLVNVGAHSLLEMNRALDQTAATLRQFEAHEPLTRALATKRGELLLARRELEQTRARALPALMERWAIIDGVKAGTGADLASMQQRGAQARARVAASLRRAGLDVNAEQPSMDVFSLDTEPISHYY